MALNEIAFQRASRRELLEAWNYCKADRRANSPRRNVSDLNTTWDSLCHVFRRLNKQLPQFTTLVLQVSPSLLGAARPGSRAPTKWADPSSPSLPSCKTARVISSKQRPRRLTNSGLRRPGLIDLAEGARRSAASLRACDAAVRSGQHAAAERQHHQPPQPVDPTLLGAADRLGAQRRHHTPGDPLPTATRARSSCSTHEHVIMKQMAPDFEHSTSPGLHRRGLAPHLVAQASLKAC